MVRMFEAYHNNEKVDFKFLNIFIVIEGCEKWVKVRHTLGKGKTYDPDTPAAGVAYGRSDNHEKPKAARYVAPVAAKLQASIDHLPCQCSNPRHGERG